MDMRPPLVVSPRRLRPRPLHALPPRHPAAPPAKNSPVTNSKAIHPLRASVSGASLFRPEPDLISSELLAMAKNAKEEEFKENRYQEHEKENKILFCPTTPVAPKTATSPLFERGRLYDLYSARRNERLRRRQLELLEETEAVKVIQNPAVAVELAKRKTSKRNESARKSISGDLSVSRIPTLRSAVRTSKEMKKNTTTGFGFDEKNNIGVGTSARRIGTRSAARRF